MNEQTDSELLRAYVERYSDPAFAELVRRHIDLVHSAALRMVCDAHLAEDVTQAVFMALAKNAAQLMDRPILSGWLHRTAQNIAAQTVRTDVRRRAREQEAALMNQLLSATPDVSWDQVAPHLDAALSELDEAERDALLFRYFERKSAREMAVQLGISDDAAQKRVSRAVERLREIFAKRGVIVGAGGLVVAISANAVQAAPVGLAVTISAAAIAGTAATTSTIIAATTKTIAMTTLQKTLVTATVAVLAGAGVYEARQAAQLRDQVQTLQQQQGPLVDQIQRLQNSFADATNRVADLIAENSRLNSQPHESELLKLRGTVTSLRNDAAQINDPVVKQALQRKSNVEKMKQLFLEHPEQKIPEMQLLSDERFFDLARDQDLESSNGMRKAFSQIRYSAESEFAMRLEQVLQKFYYTNSNQPPDSILALAPYFDPPTDSAILERYHLIETGKAILGGWRGGWVISQKETPDRDYDRQWFISPVGFSSAPFSPPEKY